MTETEAFGQFTDDVTGRNLIDKMGSGWKIGPRGAILWVSILMEINMELVF